MLQPSIACPLGVWWRGRDYGSLGLFRIAACASASTTGYGADCSIVVSAAGRRNNPGASQWPRRADE